MPVAAEDAELVNDDEVDVEEAFTVDAVDAVDELVPVCVEDAIPEELAAAEDSLYISSLSPAPQYSTLLPGHRKLQSLWVGASTAPCAVLILLPQ